MPEYDSFGFEKTVEQSRENNAQKPSQPVKSQKTMNVKLGYGVDLKQKHNMYGDLLGPDELSSFQSFGVSSNSAKTQKPLDPSKYSAVELPSDFNIQAKRHDAEEKAVNKAHAEVRGTGFTR